MKRTNKQLETLMQIFHKGGEQQKYIQEIGKMMNGMHPCKNELIGDVQMLLASTVLSKLQGNRSSGHGTVREVEGSDGRGGVRNHPLLARRTAREAHQVGG